MRLLYGKRTATDILIIIFTLNNMPVKDIMSLHPGYWQLKWEDVHYICSDSETVKLSFLLQKYTEFLSAGFCSLDQIYN